jgi:hypothetical protein
VARARRTTNPARQAAAAEIDLLRLKLTNIGGRLGGVLESQTWNAYLLADDFFDPRSSPTGWFRNGIAAWVRGLQAGSDFYRGVLSTLCRPTGPSGPQSKFDGKTITFYVDEFSEASDPVITNIPVGLIGQVTIGDGNVTKDYVNLTLSSDGRKVLVALCNLQGNRLRLVPGSDYHATLFWTGGSTPFIVNVLQTPPA